MTSEGEKSDVTILTKTAPVTKLTSIESCKKKQQSR